MELDDPCGHGDDYMAVMAIFIKYVMLGTNYNMLQNIRSDTVRNYAKDAGALFEMRDFANPVNFNDDQNWTNILISNLQCEEDIAKQRNPLTTEIFAELKSMADKESQDSVESVVFNFVALGRVVGPRAGEYAQKTQTKVEVHKYPSGKEVIKAFLADDFEFYDSKGNQITVRVPSDFDQVEYMVVIWRIQKNRQNGQRLRVDVNKLRRKICAVWNAFQAVLRKLRLGHSLEYPLAIYHDPRTKSIKYLTASKIADVLRKAARKVHPNMKDGEIQKISAHSVRVWACVLLDEAGVKPDTIKKRLRWMGESYRIYLRDTAYISKQHNQSLEEASEAVMALLEAGDIIVPELTEEDTTMGDYLDIN